VKRTLSILIFLAAVVTIAAPKYGNYEAITADRLKAHLQFIASDDLEGRNTPSRGLDIAAKYIAAQLALWGVRPGGDAGTYFQKITLRRPAVSGDKTTVNLGQSSWKYGSDYYANMGAGSADGAIVFVGAGLVTDDAGADPYKKVEVKDKVVLALSSSRRTDIQKAAADHGARAVLFVPTDLDLERWDARVKSSTNPGFPQVNYPTDTPVAFTIPTITLSKAGLEQLMVGETMTAAQLLTAAAERNDMEPFLLSPNKAIRMTVVVDQNEQYTQNVIGIVDGTDKKSEFIAIGAHYDHVGMSSSTQGDNIFNGADDDGSGTVSILEIAHAFQTGPKPKRSIVFVWHCGEEKGLWGSRYFTEKPTVPIESIVTQLNIDMIGRSKLPGDTKPANRLLTATDEVYVVGSRKLSEELGALSDSVNKDLLKLKFNYHYDEPNDPENIYGRSDHYNYARKGIPIIFYFDGVHEDYHRPGDEWQKIDYVKMQNVARTVYATAWTLSERKDRVKVDKKAP